MLWSILLIVASGCTADPSVRRFDYAQVIMGVRVNIAAYCESEVKARDAARNAFAEMVRVDGVLSDYRGDSEAMRLCDAAGSGPVPVSRTLADVLRLSREFSQASGGAFDVTAGSVVQLWRAARKKAVLPVQGDVAAALSTVGWRRCTVIEVDDGRFEVDLSPKGVRLDFGGIGKGFAADRGLAVMRRDGVPRALVGAAGDIAVGDPPPGRAGWRIEISEGGDGPGPGEFIEVFRCGVSTSGDTEQFVEIGAVRYSHIVDPRTGVGVTQRLVVTTVAPNAATADAAATTLCILPAENRAEFILAIPGLQAFVRDAGHSGSQASLTPGFPPIERRP